MLQRKIWLFCTLPMSTDFDLEANTRVGISGTTAKSRKHRFVPSSHLGPFAVVASSWKSQTNVGIVE